MFGLYPSLHSEHSKATIRAYGRVRFVLLYAVYIFKLSSYDNIVMASTISLSGKLAMVVLLTKIEKECDVYSCSYHVIFDYHSRSLT